MQQFKLKSYDDTEIFVTIWDDVVAPYGVIQLLHGMTEYAGRYDSFARYMNSRGYIVFADDHRAHGRTETPENRGRHKGNIFDKTVKDELFFRDWLKQKYDVPIFLLGHSYGSMLAQAIAEAGSDVKAIALTGTGHLRARFSLAKFLIFPIWLVAKNWRPQYGVNGDFTNTRPEIIEKIRADEFDHHNVSINFLYHMFSGTVRTYKKHNLQKLNPATSIGLFCGGEDVIGQKGKSVKKLHKLYRSYGIPCDINIYPGARHDILNEFCEDKVRSDIVDFFDKFIIYRQSTIEDLL